MARATTRRAQLDLDRVRGAVETAERTTSAEIVVTIAPFFFGRVWAAAKRAFARLGVSQTRARNGVLVFVVPARRQVVVLADEGALTQIDPAVWHATAEHIAAAFAHGRGTDGLIEGIAELARVLSVAFPPMRGDVNELPDRPFVGRPP